MYKSIEANAMPHKHDKGKRKCYAIFYNTSNRQVILLSQHQDVTYICGTYTCGNRKELLQMIHSILFYSK